MSWKKIMAPFDLYELSNARAWLMGVATLLVTFYHSQYLDLFSSAFLTRTRLLSLVTRLHKTGNSGVDLFMLLSGFGLFFSFLPLLVFLLPRAVLRRKRKDAPTSMSSRSHRP